MKRQDTSFDFSIRMPRNVMRAAMMVVLVAMGGAANGASVVSRTAPAATTAQPASRASSSSAAARMSTIAANMQNSASESTDAPADEQPVADETPEPDAPIIENKSDQFGAGLAAQTSSARDANADSLAEMVRQQRATLDAQAASETAASAAATSLASGHSACDIGLRNCMKQKCGDDYTGCAGDGDTIWGDKLDACRRDVTCTGRQYAMFTAEIKADRDMNAKLASYNKIINCGNEYNNCIVTECGTTYSKCLGKTAGDAAISKCSAIAQRCTQQDSGLASRTMNVFATLRQDAEKQIVKDEQRLYEMRDTMRAQCQRMGALFDERSLVCVYTVNFFAGDSSTPTASKKMYAGNTFDCTPDWFGIDVTTFKENAYRLTRSQTAASSAMLGSGLGQAVGAITSGAIDRAVDRKKADDAAKKAEKEHEANYGQKASDTKSSSTDNNNAAKEGESKADNKDKKPADEQAKTTKEQSKSPAEPAATTQKQSESPAEPAKTAQQQSEHTAENNDKK